MYGIDVWVCGSVYKVIYIAREGKTLYKPIKLAKVVVFMIICIILHICGCGLRMHTLCATMFCIFIIIIIIIVMHMCLLK